MKAVIVVPPANENPPQMPVEGAYMAEAFDSLGWDVLVLDVAAENYLADGVRLETVKHQPDMVVFQCHAQNYRFTKQYVEPVRKELPHSVVVAVSKDLAVKDMKEWLPVDFAIHGPPNNLLPLLSGRTETRNFDAIPNEEAGALVELPEYHARACHFAEHNQIRGGARVVDVPTTLFGKPVDGKDVAGTVAKLRMRYGINGFNLSGIMNPNPAWTQPLFDGLEEAELVGDPVNLTWTCEIPNPMLLTTGLIRQLQGHGVKHILFDWNAGLHDQIEHVIDTCLRANIHPITTFNLPTSKHEYVKMAELVSSHEGLLFRFKFLDDPNRYGDEEYVSNLSNGIYLPKSMKLHQDMETLAARDMILNRDLERLRKWAES